MIELIVMLLASLNGTDDNDDDDDNSTISGGGNLRLDCEDSDCPVINGTDLSHDLVYRSYCDNTYCPRNYYGGPETGLYDLLDRWCEPDD